MQNRFADTRSFLSQTKFYDGYSRFKEDELRKSVMNLGMKRSIVSYLEMHEENYSENTEKLNSYIRRSKTLLIRNSVFLVRNVHYNLVVNN